ncbi:MAG: 3-dehydroquinate synthase [Hydrotalea flava]|uniref:3-dehydroquinate synthase n=1 Tax=Hydrotalea TaxID=1004300 RepID=UPI00094380CA|nr:MULTISPECIES: 3-dehydroquinate synthase [Hydrotalea]MBY0347814.1 3-dehydroquinate synthase [Hydrotalea flava]NIM35923.1 3-dehydroquinate synthase [Hydrotalea flava]NIM38756.1 3-dehydroquinate synthase [Hydrotalea flava]NIN03944.1 3-dehydroquinate synthase [Hydrotalea flava]NIN15665.1 3-dehydroquinate synthase [Hydrotalea flava]
MLHQSVQFNQQHTDFYFDASFRQLKQMLKPANTFIITDTNIFPLHTTYFKGWKTIVIPAGEAHKNIATVQYIIEQLIQLQADRTATLVGVGGGVVTDITGFVAAIYMRGVAFGFVPTTVLAMVDASIGGKNGIDIGLYKNLMGTIRQPAFLLYDTHFLKTLPDAEWQNGFAEIIKHACIKNAAMFRNLEKLSPALLKKNKQKLNELIQKNVQLKMSVVKADEFEKGERKLLNLGHTLGHAIENQYGLSHGHAVAIGIHYAAILSQQILGFKQPERISALLTQYGLPTHFVFDTKKVMNMLQMDKKRQQEFVHYILIEKIGKGIILPIPLKDLEKFYKII